MLLPDIVRIPLKFNGRPLREMLAYPFPLLVLGIAGIMNPRPSTRYCIRWLATSGCDGRYWAYMVQNYKIAP